MNVSTLERAVDRATRSLHLAYDRLQLELPGDVPLSPSREQAEERLRAETERLYELLERARKGRTADPAALERAADDLDDEVASFDEVLEAEQLDREQ